jgi:DNA invertase Pin-like site-specific DNA recombinase
MVRAAAIYARISDDREGLALGVARQIEDCEALAERRGWPIAERYVDNDVSAWSSKKRRPEYLRLLDDIKGGHVDAVIVYVLDRLHRQPRELEEFFEVCDAAGITALASVTGDVDLANADGRFMARILGAVSRKESDDKSRRIKRKHEELAKAGKVSGGGTRPYGYDADRMTIRKDEAAVIREAAKRVLAGEGIRSIVRDFDSRGIKPALAEFWHPRALQRVLMSARIGGVREHHGTVAGTAEWASIISAEDSARLRAILSDPARRTSRAPRRYLLAGLLRCGHCGARLMSRPRKGSSARYLCASGPGFAGCGKTYIVAPDLEAWITEAVLIRLDSPDLAKKLAKGDRSNEAGALADELAQDTAQLDEVASAYGSKAITLSEWLAARKPIEARIEHERKRLSRMSATSALDGFVGCAGRLKKVWSDLPLNRQRAIVGAVMDHAVIGPAVKGRNWFDPDRVQPVWRK